MDILIHAWPLLVVIFVDAAFWKLCCGLSQKPYALLNTGSVHQFALPQ